MATETDILLKEYETLRSEVIERLKTAFAHFGYFGAVVALAFPASEKVATSSHTPAILAGIGAAILVYISIINWLWVSRLASHLRKLEGDINQAIGKPVLSWEGKAQLISRWVLLPPKPYQ
jgi:hypothetical protein